MGPESVHIFTVKRHACWEKGMTVLKIFLFNKTWPLLKKNTIILGRDKRNVFSLTVSLWIHLVKSTEDVGTHPQLGIHSDPFCALETLFE
jgi:hypothetical protein